MKALGMIEVYSFSTAVRVADIAAKAADVKIIAFDRNRPFAPGFPVPLIMVVKMEGDVAAVEAEFKKFSSMEKGIIDLIPAAVEAVKQETIKKIKLFSSDGKADLTKASGVSTDNVDLVTKLVIEEVKKYLNK